MSERERWMPTSVEITMAWYGATGFPQGPLEVVTMSDPEPFRALIRAAVEKALAEQDQKHSGAVEDLMARFRGLLAEQEAQHRREVLNAQVSSLVRIEALLASRRGTALQVVRDAIDALRAELAAMEGGGS